MRGKLRKAKAEAWKRGLVARSCASTGRKDVVREVSTDDIVYLLQRRTVQRRATTPVSGNRTLLELSMRSWRKQIISQLFTFSVLVCPLFVPRNSTKVGGGVLGVPGSFLRDAFAERTSARVMATTTTVTTTALHRRTDVRQKMFANTWQDAVASGRREKEYSGTIIPTLHGLCCFLGVCVSCTACAGADASRHALRPVFNAPRA